MPDTKTKRQAGGPGALEEVKRGSFKFCSQLSIPPATGQSVRPSHPMARIALQNFQFDLECLTERDQAQESCLRAVLYLLRNF